MPRKKGKCYAKVLVNDAQKHKDIHKDIILDMKKILDMSKGMIIRHCYAESLTNPKDALNQYWKEVYIPKKSGGSRQIMIPDYTLQNYFKNILHFMNSAQKIGKEIMKNPVQKKRLYAISKDLGFHEHYCFEDWLLDNDSSHGFEKQRSIVTHATKHKDATHFFKTDIKAAFPSLRQDDIREVMKTYLLMSYLIVKTYGNLIYGGKVQAQYSRVPIHLFTIANQCAIILAPEQKLLTGTSLSPFILNKHLTRFDKRLNTYCKKRGYNYSRYADDILISSSKALPREVRNYVRHNLEDFHMVMNNDKTRFQTCRQKNVITGIVISYDKKTHQGYMGIGYDKFNKLKKDLYQLPQMDEAKQRKTLGMLSYLESVNKERSDYLKKKYAKQLASI